MFALMYLCTCERSRRTLIGLKYLEREKFEAVNCVTLLGELTGGFASPVLSTVFYDQCLSTGLFT